MSIDGTRRADTVVLGSGTQVVNTGDGKDKIISYADGGEPDPAQTAGAEGRVNSPVAPGSGDDILTGGGGADTFEFRTLINAKPEVIAQHTNLAGVTNWAAVAGENDNVHDHWVEGIGTDTITDYSKAEGDAIVVRGHTTQIQSITYSSDAGGDYSLITLYSQQGDGGAGGANTATGAHDEDPLGQIKVYGDIVTVADVRVINSNQGIDRLYRSDAAYEGYEGGITQEVYSNTDGTAYYGNLARQTDIVKLGLGAQSVNAGGGKDIIVSFSDEGEPDPAQTVGSDGRVNPAVDAGLADDVLAGGQGPDTFAFRLLINAKQEIIDQHTRNDGTVNWKRVAGENENVHDHWVEGIGNDVILDFSKQDGDRIDIRGHTVEIAAITYGVDGGGDYSLITLRSQQGDGGGAHDEDPLGTIKVYGDTVTATDITLKAGVFFGMDRLDQISAGEVTSLADNAPSDSSEIQWGAADPETIDLTFTGSARNEVFRAGSGAQTVMGGDGNDKIISYGDAGEPDPAQSGPQDRVNPALPAGAADDVFFGGGGGDTFVFNALLNGKRAVVEQHTQATGTINWARVAGENDNTHDHWVEGFGNDVIGDYSKAEGDKIVIRGHTVEVASITYDTDAGGDYSLIQVISQQGDGGAGGANTATGAHDEDSLGTIKVYGDRVEEVDVQVVAGGVVDGADRLPQVDALVAYNGGSQSFASSTDGASIVTAAPTVKTVDFIEIGSGAQTVSAGLNKDVIRSYADAGEQMPAQTGDPADLVNGTVDPALAADTIAGGQDADVFFFNPLLNARAEVLARHTQKDGSINWKAVAGENEAVHDHWVEGIGDDVILDYSKQDGDRIILRGHTVEVASITYGEDDGGDYSLLLLRSQQGDGGGAHDEDPLGSLKVYGDTVTADDLTIKAGVTDGIDRFEPMADRPNVVFGTRGNDGSLTGTEAADIIKAGGGRDVLHGFGDDDFLFGGNGKDFLFGGNGKDWLEGGRGNDFLFGGDGSDTLVANSGRDLLVGGADADTFLFNGGILRGRILDFEDDLDLIDFTRMSTVNDISDLNIVQTSEASYSITFTNEAGNTALINLNSNTAFTLDDQDFLF